MKKFIALLLAVIMVLSMVACSPAQNNISDKLTGASDKDNANSEDTAANGEAAANGIFTNPQWDGALPLVQPGEDNVLTIGLRASANALDYETNEFTLWVEEQTGLDLQFVTFAGSAKDAATQVSLMIAGGEALPDILLNFSGIGKGIAKEYGRDGYFTNLAEYFATDAYYMRQSLEQAYGEDYAQIEKEIMATITDPVSQGVYNYPCVYQSQIDNLLAQMWINQVWLDNLGLEKPTNIHELYDVLVAFRDGDPNGNGLKDEIPMIGRDGNTAQDLVGWLVNAFIYYNISYKFNVENGVVYSPYDQPEYREALIYMKKLVDEGLLSNMTWTMTNAELLTLVNPDGDFTVGVISASGDERFEIGHESMRQYVPLAPLADETGRGGYGPVRADLVHYYTFITEDCSKPQLAFRLLDFLCSSEAYLRSRWGVKGVNWDYIDESNTLPGALGGEARIELLTEDVFSSVNNQCWHIQQSVCASKYWQYALDTSTEEWKAVQYRKLQEQMANYEAAGMPDDVIRTQQRNDAEEEIFQEHNSDLNTFVAKARANFCTGVTDPSNDADWNAYISDLYEMGYQESWIDVAQSCYDRDHGK